MRSDYWQEISTGPAFDDSMNENVEQHSAIHSFYEYPTVMPNPEESDADLNETVNMVVLKNSLKPPSYEFIVKSFHEKGIYEERNCEMKKYGVSYSLKSDADNSNGNYRNHTY